MTAYWAPPSGSRRTSLDSVRWRNSSACGPRVSISPMCETSNTPACSRTARCSSRTPAYWTGISQPANGTILAPAASCRSNRAVRFRVSAPGTGGRLAAPSRRAGGRSGTSVAVSAAARRAARAAARRAARAAAGGGLRRCARRRARAANLDRSLHPETLVAVDRAVPRVRLPGLERDRERGRLSGGDGRALRVLAARAAALDLDRMGNRTVVLRSDRDRPALHAGAGGGELVLRLAHGDRVGARGRCGRGGG